MKKKIRRLRLNRETIRNLTPDVLGGVAGGDADSRVNSCNFAVTRPLSYCNSCSPIETACLTCQPSETCPP